MPGLDGYELAFEVRNNPQLAGIYIILHTSLSSEISVDRAHQVGANEALEKFDAAELLHGMLRGALHVERGDVVPGRRQPPAAVSRQRQAGCQRLSMASCSLSTAIIFIPSTG